MFYTSDRSRKARELAGNPRVALLMHWPSLTADGWVRSAVYP